MKRKTLAAGLLSLCLLGISTSQVVAGIFDCWCRHKYTTQITCRPYNAFTPICWGNLVCDGCCPNPCGCASGCLPMTMGVPPWACQGGGCGMPPPCMGGGCGMPGGFGMGGPEGGCCASDMGPMMAGPPMRPGPQPMPMAPDGRNPGFVPPMPMPVGPNTTMMMPMPMGPNPMMMPMPMGPNTTMMPMPMGPNTTMMYPPNPGVAQAAYQPNYQQPYYPMPYPNYYMPPNYYPYAGWQQPTPSYWYGGGR